MIFNIFKKKEEQHIVVVSDMYRSYEIDNEIYGTRSYIFPTPDRNPDLTPIGWKDPFYTEPSHL